MIETISFGDSFPSLQSYEKKNWLLNETRNVEFFKDCFYKVTLISSESPDLQNYLKEIDVQTPIALDLEWENEINSLQFAIQNRVLVIRHPNGPGNKLIYDYLLNHKFFAKGCHNDKIKLKEKFGYNFESNIEDIERTRLQPYGYSLNFIQMTLQFAGKPTTEFKDVRITKSNWDQKFLTIRQVLYAAFDVVSIFQSYKNFPPPKEIIHQKEPKKVQKHESNKSNKPKNISNKKDFNLTQSEWKTDGQKILLKQSFSKRIQCYIITNYSGPTDYISTKNVLKSIPQDIIDHISNFKINGLTFLFISLFSAENSRNEVYFSQLLNLFEKNQIITIPILDPADSTDNDVIFLSCLPNELKNEDQLNLFLSCFGSDFRFSFDQNFNARIQPHRAQSSLRMKNFIPFICSNDNRPLMTFSIFPYYLPMIRATFPPSFSTCEEVERIFSQCGKVEKVTIFDKKTENDNLTAIVTFSKIEEAIKSIEEFNYFLIGPSNEEVYVQRYTDENHFRFLRFHELLVNGIENEKELRKRFEKYGEVLQAKYDRLFHISRVYYIEKKSAILAAQNEKCANLAPLSTMAFIRNLPFTTTDHDIIELTKPFGKVLGFVYRDLVKEMKGVVVEVMFSTHEEAFALKTALHHKKVGNSLIEVNASTLEELETPIWKMQQRKRWVTCIVRVESPLDDKNDFCENVIANEYDSYESEDADDDDESDSENAFSSTDESNEYSNDNVSNIKKYELTNNNEENNNDNKNENESINNDDDQKEKNLINNNNDSINNNENRKEKDLINHNNDSLNNNGNESINCNNNNNSINNNENQKEKDLINNKNESIDSNNNDPINNNDDKHISSNNSSETNDSDDDSTDTVKDNKNTVDKKISNVDASINNSSLKSEESDFVDFNNLIKSCESVGTVVDVRTKLISINDNSKIKSQINYQKVFILFANPVSTTQVIRRFKQYNIKMSTIGEFVNEILPEQFILRKLDTEDLKSTTLQPTAIVINNRPSFMDDNCIHKMLFNIRAYEFVIEEKRAIIYTKSKRVAQHIFKTLSSFKSKQFISINNLVNAFGNHYSNAQNQAKVKNDVNSQINSNAQNSVNSLNSSNNLNKIEISKKTSSLHNEKNANNNANPQGNLNILNSSAEENKMKVEMFVWFAVPNRPRFHPFERIISQRKMPIVIDPIPKNTTAPEVRAFCDGCGRFDVKVQGSSCEVGKRRAIIQPRNTKAKMSCFEIFKNERFKGEFFSPIRIKKDEIPPPLDENSDDQTEYD